MSRDVWHAARPLARTPFQTALVMIMLGLGIGASVAAFSIIDALLLKRPAVGAADRLRFVYSVHRRGDVSYPTYASFKAIEASNGVFEELAAIAPDPVLLGIGASRQDRAFAFGERVSPGYFATLRIEPALGRLFGPGDDQTVSEPVVILSDRLWKARFHGDPNVLGRPVTLDGIGRRETSRTYAVVGVMPAAFTGILESWRPADFWVLRSHRLIDEACENAGREDAAAYLVVGRLGASATDAQLRESLRLWTKRGVAALPRVSPDWSLAAFDGRAPRMPFRLTGTTVPRHLALAMMVVAGLILGVTVLNLAVWLCARTLARRDEFATRIACGATRWHLFRQFVVESLVLVTPAALIGLATAWILVHVFVDRIMRFAVGPSAAALNLGIEIRAVGVALVMTLASALILSAIVSVLMMRKLDWPALQSIDVNASRGGRLLHGLLVPQLAASFALALMAGAVVKDVLWLERQPLGYEPANLGLVEFEMLVPSRCEETEESAASLFEARQRYQSTLLAAVAADPAVSHATLTTFFMPLEDLFRASVLSEPRATAGRRALTVSRVSAIPGYFGTLGIRVQLGRDFTSTDLHAKAPEVVAVDRTLARLLWGDESPLGQRLAFIDSPEPGAWRWHEVIAVVDDVRPALAPTTRGVVYDPLARGLYSRVLVFRTPRTDNASVLARVSATAARLSKDVEMIRATMVEPAIADLRFPRRVAAAALSASTGVTMLLSILGVAAAVSYAVGQRMREIAIRVALGASSRAIHSLMGTHLAVALALALVAGGALGIVAQTSARRAFPQVPAVSLSLAWAVAGGVATVVWLVLVGALASSRRRALVRLLRDA